MPVKHIVIWTLSATEESEKAEALIAIREALTGLIGTVPSIRSLTVGVNGAYPDSNSDVAVVADFDDFDGVEEYQVHPAHLAAAAIVRSHVSGRAGIDYAY